MANSSRNPNKVLLEAEQKGYSRILFQQGKPVCDFELTLLGDLSNPRRIAAPYIGSGVPAGSDGFAIGNLDLVNSDFSINAGRCLVSGIEVVLQKNTTYKTQPHQERVGPFPKGLPSIYLHVFPTEITDQEDAELKNAGDVGTVTAVRERMDWEVVVSQDLINQPDHYLLAILVPDAHAVQITGLSTMISDRRRKGLTTAALRDEFDLLSSTNSDLNARVNAISNPDGTLKNNVVGTAQLAINAVTANKIVDGSVTSTKLAAGAVTNTQLANNAVTGSKIADGSVTGTKLGVGAVANAQLADNAVTVNKILDGSVNATKLAANAVTSGQLANNAVTTSKILDGSVTGIKLPANAITGIQLADNAVTTNKILDGSVTGIKLPANAITGIQLADNAVTTNKILDGNVTTAKLAANAVTNAQLANNAVTTSKILDGSVTGIKLPANAITGIQLADNAVTTNKIVDANVTAAKLAANAVNETNLVTNAVSKRTIQDKAVSMAELGLTLVFDGQASLPPATLVGAPGQQVVVPSPQFIQLLTADAHAFFLVSVRVISPRQLGTLNTVNWMHRSVVVLSSAQGNPAIHQHQVVLQNFSTTATLTVACQAFRLAET